MCPEVSLTAPSGGAGERSDVSSPGVGLTSALGGFGLSRPSTSSIAASSVGGGGGIAGGLVGAGVGGGGGSSLAAVAGSAVASAIPATHASGTRSPSASGPAGAPRRFDEDVELPLIKVVVLGAAGVGKTSLARRFASNDFPREHHPSTKKSEFFPSLVLNESLFELKLIDLPPISYFPPNSEAEWKDFRFFGLRSASAYLLVYDASAPSTFQHVRMLRDQMYESRDMTNVPVIVAANKSDKAAAAAAASAAANQHQHHGHHGKGSHGQPGGSSGAERAARERKEAAHLVRKAWRSAHVDCSAKYNWNVVTVFRELAVMLEMIANGQVIGQAQPAPKKKRCFVF